MEERKSVIYPRIAISNCSGESPFPYFLKRYIVPVFEFHVIHTELIKVATGCFKTESENFPTRNEGTQEFNLSSDRNFELYR